MERLPQRSCLPSELGNPQRTRVPTFPQRRRLRLLNWTKLPNPRKSHVFPDSCAEPIKDDQDVIRTKMAFLANIVTLPPQNFQQS